MTASQSWTFTQPSPLGDVRSSYELDADGLKFLSEAPLGGGAEALRWDAIVEAATATVELPAGKGGPDMPGWMPGRLEWLLVARADRPQRAFMRPLPASEARDAIVERIRERLGNRWIGERLALASARQRFALSSAGDGWKVAGLVVAVLALLVALLLVVAVLTSVLALPAALALGGWAFHRGLIGLRDALHAANTPTAKVSSAAIGLVEFEGRALTDSPSAAGASGRPSVWWDVAVDAWSDDDDGGNWRQIAARHGGNADTLRIEDATGCVPLWLRDADLLLDEQTWESGKHALPPPALALLASAGLAWDGRTRLRVREQCMEAGGTLYVLGTLDEARQLAGAGEARDVGRLRRALQTGAWRMAVLRRLPAVVRAPFAVTIAYLDMLFGLGRGRERPRRLGDAPPPALDVATVVVWKGRAGRPFVVSDRPEGEALSQLRKRSLLFIGVGTVVLCWVLHELIQLF